MQKMSAIESAKRFIPALLMAVLLSAPVGAATLTVTKTVDTGDGVCDTDCSLREAIWVASAGDTINFAPSLNSQTITLVNTIPLDKNLTIQGPGLSLLTILNNASYTIAFVTNGTGVTVTFDGVTLRGTSTNALLHNKSSDTVTFTNSVLSDCGDVNSGANGGAVWNEGTLTLASSTVSNNAANRAGAILSEPGAILTITNSHLENNTANSNGAILNRGTLTIQNSILTGNQTSEYGGAIHNDGGNLTITDSTLSNNAAPFGGGILTGNDGTVTISNSTLSNNNATYDGGAILIFAGTVTVTNSTFSGNTANNGGGIANSGTLTVTNSTVSGNTAGVLGGGIASDSAVTVRQSTITGNSATTGGGITSHALTIGNSLVAGNTATTGREINVEVSWSSQGYNLIGFSSSTGMSGASNPALTATDFTPTVGLSQIIGALINNGGLTQTHALVTGSPAINAGSNALATAAGLSTDQRGQPRFSGTVDIGSYEVQSSVVNGACGASAGQTFTNAPSSNLCTAGSPSSVTTNPGTFTWNCTGSNGGSTASCSATRAFTVTPSASTQGSITPNTAVTVAYNATRAFTVTPNLGYTASVSGCSGSLSGATYTTGPITANCTVAANFVAQTYTVTATAGAGGAISPGSALVSSNQTTAFTVTPNTGYTASVSGCSGSLSGTTYTTGPITANCAVSATFSPVITYTVIASAGANGIISPLTQSVNPGATTTLTVTPNTGYTATVAGCGGTLTGTTYTTAPITASCSVVATFSPTATASAPVITTAVLPDAIVGVPYATVLTAIGGQYPYTYTAADQPPGLTLTTEGILHGIPTTSGAFAVTVTVTDALGQHSARGYALTVGAGLALLTADLPDALVNIPYTQTLAAIGGHPPYTFTATGLPTGFSLSSSGALRGTPLEPGDAAVQLTVTDTLNQRATNNLVLTVRDTTFTEPNPEQPDEDITGAAKSCPAANTTTRTLKLGDPGAPATGPDGVTLPYGLLEIKVTGCQPGQTVLVLTTAYPAPLPSNAQYWKYGRTRDNEEPHWYVLPGAIIEGNAITLLIVDGDIGDSDLAVDGNILDPGGPGITLNTIDGAVPAILPIREPYRADFQVRCNAGACPANSVYDWSLAAGALPDGLTLTKQGATATLSGTPTRTGRYPFTVQVLTRGITTTSTQQSYTVRITDGSPDSAATTLITHYYVSILEREPEADGLAYWQGLIAEHEAQKIDIKPVFRNMANFFFNSPEYLGRNTTDRQFITNLYLTFFQREPDEGGYAFWLEQLANGMARNTAMAGFLYSQEFTDFMAALGF